MSRELFLPSEEVQRNTTVRWTTGVNTSVALRALIEQEAKLQHRSVAFTVSRILEEWYDKKNEDQKIQRAIA